ncbi:hypothetical protein WDW89_02185 [Deltaproteobacteria bacterium TL4]
MSNKLKKLQNRKRKIEARIDEKLRKQHRILRNCRLFQLGLEIEKKLKQQYAVEIVSYDGKSFEKLLSAWAKNLPDFPPLGEAVTPQETPEPPASV